MKLCRRCGHVKDAHKHFHDLDYCGLKGCGCRSYKKKWWWNR